MLGQCPGHWHCIDLVCVAPCFVCLGWGLFVVGLPLDSAVLCFGWRWHLSNIDLTVYDWKTRRNVACLCVCRWGVAFCFDNACRMTPSIERPKADKTCGGCVWGGGGSHVKGAWCVCVRVCVYIPSQNICCICLVLDQIWLWEVWHYNITIIYCSNSIIL